MKKLTMDEFPTADYDSWKKAALKELKDKPFESLIWENENGFSVEPYFMQSKYYKQQIPTDKQGWEICQTITVDNMETANRQALQCLSGGASALRFEGMIPSYEAFRILLKDIGIQYITIHFRSESNADALQLLQWLKMYCEKNTIDSQEIKGSIQRNVLKALAEGEGWKALLDFCSDNFPSFRCFSVDAFTVHNSGGNATQDIAYALSAGNEFLHFAAQSGYSPKEITGLVQFNFATDTSYFMEIAKYRVFRNLWFLIVNQYSGSMDFTAPYIFTETSTYLQTTRDVYNNLLRATTQAMSAAIAMVDSIEVIAHDHSFQPSSETSLRLARNIQHLLMEESNFSGSQDLAAGSHYIENLSKELAESAWKLFLEIEKQGGMRKAENWFDLQVEKTAKQRVQSVHDGSRIIVGTNKYVNLKEEKIEGSPGRLASNIS